MLDWLRRGLRVNDIEGAGIVSGYQITTADMRRKMVTGPIFGADRQRIDHLEQQLADLRARIVETQRTRREALALYAPARNVALEAHMDAIDRALLGDPPVVIDPEARDLRDQLVVLTDDRDRWKAVAHETALQYVDVQIETRDLRESILDACEDAEQPTRMTILGAVVSTKRLRSFLDQEKDES
jgi:hypothetical protein